MLLLGATTAGQAAARAAYEAVKIAAALERSAL
jgi:hypothetical protein